MLRTKEILAAGIVRDIQFCSKYALDVYLYGLDQNKITYQILEQFNREDGSVIIRIVQQYNQSPLIELYKED